MEIYVRVLPREKKQTLLEGVNKHVWSFSYNN
jgi:hypothetical protein